MGVNLLQARLKKIVGESRSKKEALLKAGYKKSTAEKQQKRTFKAPVIQEAIKKMDSIALKRHQEAFDAEKVVALPDEPNVVLPDHTIRLKAVDMQYKARGVYQEGTTINQQFNDNKTFVLPSELLEKYDITSDTKDSSKG